uniref:CG6004 n=1 Tax=Solanum tuberosum TaxID=4113 RepID=M1DFN3_SOLTU
MVCEPPVGTFRSPDQSQQRRLEQTNKTHQESPSNSSYNSTNSRNNEAMNIAISEKELEGIQKIISPDRDMVIHGKLFSGNESTNQGLQHTKKSGDSTLPIERTEEAISGKIAAPAPEHPQIRSSSQQFHGDWSTGDYSPDEEVYLTEISSKMDGPIAGDKESGDRTDNKLKCDGAPKGHFSTDEEVQLTNISINLAQEHIQKEIQASLGRITTNQQVELEELTYRPEAEQQGTYTQDHAGANGQKQDQHTIDEHGMEMQSKQRDKRIRMDQNDQHDNTKSTTLEVIDVESSSHFSFGVKPTETIPSNGGQQRPGKSSNSDSSRNAVSLSCSDGHVHANAKEQNIVNSNDQEQGREDNESQQQGDRNQSGQQTNHPNQAKGPSTTNENQTTKQDQNAEPAPYTVEQMLAARLRQIHATHATSIELVPPRHTTKQGQPAVIYDMDDFMNKLTVDLLNSVPPCRK